MKNNLNKHKALIHIQKKELGLTDDEYRTILQSVTGKTSTSEMNYTELSKIINSLNTLLVASGKASLGYISPTKSGSSGSSGHSGSSNNSGKNRRPTTFLEAVKSKAYATLGKNADARLKGFLQKMNKTSLDECTSKELRRVMGFLSTLQKQTKR